MDEKLERKNLKMWSQARMAKTICTEKIGNEEFWKTTGDKGKAEA